MSQKNITKILYGSLVVVLGLLVAALIAVSHNQIALNNSQEAGLPMLSC